METDDFQYQHTLSLQDRQCHTSRCYAPTKTGMTTKLSCVGYFWAFLSFIAMAASCVGFYLPFWLQGTMRNNTPTYLGIFRRCNYLQTTDGGDVEIVMECGRYTKFSDIPSLWWQVSTVITGVGCGIQVLVAFTALFCCCCQDVVSHTSAKCAGVLQFFSGLCIGAGCSLYPLGWHSGEVRQACGITAGIYNLGECTLGWAYFTAIGGGAAVLMCSLFSCHAPKYRHAPYKSDMK